MGVRAGPGRGAPGLPGTPDSTGACSPETGAARLPFRVRPPRRPGSSNIAAHGRVILSDRDLAVMAKAVARGRQDCTDAAGGQAGPGPGSNPPAEELRRSAPPPAITKALSAAT